MRLEAITWERLAGELARCGDGLSAADGGPWLALGIDGAPAARTGESAERLARELRLLGRAVLVISTEGFLRPASLRFEYGKRDPDAYLDSWYDTGALWREVFGPLEAGGSGRVLPDLWDPVTDRATRTPYHSLPEGGVVVVHGPFLLGHWFPFALSVHLRLSPGRCGDVRRSRSAGPCPPSPGTRTRWRPRSARTWWSGRTTRRTPAGRGRPGAGEPAHGVKRAPPPVR